MNPSQQEYYEDQAGFKDEAKEVKRQEARFHPHNCVGMVEAKGVSTLIGTGFLIASNLVLTVAHNVCENDKVIPNIMFYLGVSGQIEKGSEYEVEAVRIPEDYLQTRLIKYDYALLKLKRRVHRQAYIELGVDYIEQNEKIGVLGYRPWTTKYNSQDVPESSIQFSQWKAGVHKTDKLKEHVLYHRLSTFSGNSGGPILVQRSNKIIAVAIHKGFGAQSKQNAARTITKEVLIDLLKWERQMTPSQIRFSFMAQSTETIDKVESDRWLQSISQRIEAMISHFKELKLQNKPEFQLLFEGGGGVRIKQQRHIQVQEYYLDDLVKRLKALPFEEKQSITSLTLKRNSKSDLVVMTLR